MKIERIGEESPCKEYTTDETITIQEAAERYGLAHDSIRLYTDDGTLVGIARWPQGHKAYEYCTSPTPGGVFDVYHV